MEVAGVLLLTVIVLVALLVFVSSKWGRVNERASEEEKKRDRMRAAMEQISRRDLSGDELVSGLRNQRERRRNR